MPSLSAVVLPFCVASATAIPTYQLTVDKPEISMGDSVTVSWNGACSKGGHCEDWVSAYQVGACNGTSTVGANTCYMKNEWVCWERTEEPITGK